MFNCIVGGGTGLHNFKHVTECSSGWSAANRFTLNSTKCKYMIDPESR